jgi:hypothetical protein
MLARYDTRDRPTGLPGARTEPRFTLRATLDASLRMARTLRGAAAPATVRRVPPPSLCEFESGYRRPNRAAIFTGLTDDWPARARWSLSYLRERFGRRFVPVLPTSRGFMHHDGKRGLHFRWMSLAEYLDQLESGEHPECYLVSPLDRALPELVEDVVDPIYSRDRPFRLSRFWLSAPGTSTPLHRDLTENFFVQMVGHKRFYLYPPRDSPWLYSYSFRSGLPNFSRFDPERPDYERFPLARRVRPIEVVLHPGDVLYLPSRWWHQPRSLDLSMSVNFWWADGALEKIVRLAEWVKRVRGLEIYGLADAQQPVLRRDEAVPAPTSR